MKNIRRRYIVLLLVVVMVCGLFGCGSAVTDTGDTEPTQNAETNAEGEIENVDVDSETAGTGASIVIYTNSATDGRSEWLTERAAEAGFNISVVSGTTMNRLIAEKNAPVADVCWGLNSFSYEILKEEGVLEAFVPDWADEVEEGLNDEEGYYHATGLQAILLCYDRNQLSEESAPSDWLDLWTNSAYIGTYEYATDTGTSTFRTFLAGILSRYADESGYLGVSDEGWKQVEMYYENGVSASSGVDLYAHIADSTSPIVMGEMWSSGVKARDEQYGTDTGYVVPSVGVPFVVEALALVKDSANTEEAQRFINWFGSAEIQAEYAAEFSAIPANVNAQYAMDDFNLEISTLPQQEIDWVWVAEYIEEWCEEIELMYK